MSHRDNGSRVRVRVPASSANLGPGYDSFGLALALFDEVIAERTGSGLRIEVSGIGAGTVPTDGRHLVARAAGAAFDAMGEPTPGMSPQCTNAIPHGSGLGSSAAAIVAGILVARALAPGGDQRLPDQEVFTLATRMEGHPDNVAPVLFGGITIAWSPAGPGSAPRSVRLRPHPDLRAITLVADRSCATEEARAALPATVPHADAAANSARAGLLVYALTTDPDLLLDATDDRLHQPYRAAVMPESFALLHRLRSAGIAAVLSGAGPSVLALGTHLPDPDSLSAAGFRAARAELWSSGATVEALA
jgi:homoserine kinase